MGKEAYFGPEGEPVLLKGMASLQRAYDSAGNVTEEAYFDGSGRPVVAECGYARVVRTYDEGRRLASESYYGPQGEPVPVSGAVRVEFRYDAEGKRSEVIRFDEKGNRLE